MKRTICMMVICLALIILARAGIAQAEEELKGLAVKPVIMAGAKDFSSLAGMSGFSDTLLNNHFKLYQGYVKNTNLILEKLVALLADKKENSPDYSELKRRFGWEFNGMLLHEYYFENLGGKQALDVNSALYKKIIEDFGSFDTWKQDFTSTGLMRGIGWAVVYWEPKTDKLINAWINEHDEGHIAGSSPILVMDVFEHAYMSDYQLDRAKYIEAFFKNINWEASIGRFNECLAKK